MDSNGSLRVLKASYSSLSILMCPYGSSSSLCVLMDCKVFLRTLLSFDGSLWVLINVFCALRGPYGSLMVFMQHYVSLRSL